MFKDNLVSLRKIHGYSQDELAEKIGVTRQIFSKYETGGGLSGTESAEVIVDAAGLRVRFCFHCL